jgi:sporulation protein YlmC with PRC-barrel domain
LEFVWNLDFCAFGLFSSHMVLHSKELIGLPVTTSAGQALGKVGSFELDTETGRFTSLFVKTRGLVPGLMDHELSVAWNQIVEITPGGVIVADAVAPIGAGNLAMRPETTASGIHLSEQEGASES